MKKLEPITKVSFAELMKEKLEKNLPYILAVTGTEENNAQFFDALNLTRLISKNLVNLIEGNILFFSIDGTKENHCFNYLGNSNETGSRKHFIDTYLEAAQNNSQAGCNLGNCYANGNGIDQDMGKAAHWFNHSALLGCALAQFNLGVLHSLGEGVEQDMIQAIKWFFLSSKHGNAQAEFNLGICYSQGLGIEQNLSEAYQWYLRSAMKGNAQAECSLGICYAQGNGVEKDLEEALKWLTLSAVHGNAEAECNLGICYATGNGVEKDLNQAVDWFTLSAYKGNPQARNYLNNLLREEAPANV